jgi:hypothetical protein
MVLFIGYSTQFYNKNRANTFVILLNFGHLSPN